MRSGVRCKGQVMFALKAKTLFLYSFFAILLERSGWLVILFIFIVAPARTQEVIPSPAVLWQKSFSGGAAAQGRLSAGADGSVLVLTANEELENGAYSSAQSYRLLLFRGDGKQQAALKEFAQGLAVKGLTPYRNRQWLLVADSFSASMDNRGVALVSCYSPAIERQWTRYFPNQRMLAVDHDENGRVYVGLRPDYMEQHIRTVPTPDAFDRVLFPITLACLDKKGGILWQKMVHVEGWPDAAQMLVTNNRLYLSVNTTILSGPDHHDVSLIQLSKKGQLKWQRQMTGTSRLGNLQGRALIADPEGRILLGGISTDSVQIAGRAGSPLKSAAFSYAFIAGFDPAGSVTSWQLPVVSSDRLCLPALLLRSSADKQNSIVAVSDSSRKELRIGKYSTDPDSFKNSCPMPLIGDLQLVAGEQSGTFYILRPADKPAVEDGRNIYSWQLAKMKVSD